mmetsp:Transcript_32454/g.58664  ORF Transcript_32454/g.58664 Transcript_32454/m.58664 type:complete len:151 (-) Transcript_32454:1075-1527(-)|eukprot:CAMPEP_0201885252 /NCGR_PEP_ID=MMETSP0902-20130614/18414_1 /ASSEMBLY_ACC=CAM_ASM_000551 /TAXON_ID=420261 /ORGANISM="Thalassiosira antarctica, Strain CCMP982" /LENGTH=150 /DNA_ID=CAMNT_0048414387 /DNA_START=146 /DNA_END=598 /DNA_ORIENTATION=-
MTSDLTAVDNTSSSTIQPTAEIAESSPSFSNVPWPVRPSPGINYDFVSIMYLAGSSLALLFYTLEKYILAPLLEEEGDNEDNFLNESNETSDVGSNDDTEEGGDAWKEFAKGMEGMYFIFVPFIPCLLWGLVVRYYWLKETRVSREKKAN